jgi:general secretion pathway protein N
MVHTAQRAAWLGAGLGLLLALLLFAPARWLAHGLAQASGEQLLLVNTRGTVWQGQGDLLFTGGADSRSQTALAGGLRWQVRLGLTEGTPALKLRLNAPCCTPEPLALSLRPHLGGGELRLAASTSRWPADLLSGLGTPWNTLQLQGLLAVQTEGFMLRQAQGRTTLQGALEMDVLDLASRLSTLRPLGSYRLQLKAAEDGHTATLQLDTLQGDLLLTGAGQWVGGRLRFTGEAQATPARETALSNLLNIMGRRQGARSVFSVGQASLYAPPAFTIG